MLKVAIIMAHPDDEVLGCGGSMSRLASEGASIHILIMASGLTARGPADATALSALKDQALRASVVLGADDVEFAGFPDNSMDTHALLSVVKVVENFLEKIDPDLIFTHHNGDINIDHDITQRAVMTATRALPSTKPVTILACEILSSTEFGPANKRLQPHYYMRLNEKDVNAAIEALLCYNGEIRSWPHPRSVEAFKHQFLLRGAECGSEAAEAFEVLRVVQ